MLFCIDDGTPELLLAKHLGFDAVIAHHPAGGTALLNFPNAFKRHIQQMVEAGVPVKEAKRAVSGKLKQLEVEAHTKNYLHTIEFAKLLKMPFMNIHTPLDEIGRRRMIEQIKNGLEEKSTVKDVVSALMKLPEFRNASTKIEIRSENQKTKLEELSFHTLQVPTMANEIAKTYFQHGVDTLIYIHISPADLEKLKAEKKGNLIVTDTPLAIR